MFGFVKFKKPESRGFKYKPRYYDPEKEALQHKIKAKLEEQSMELNSDNFEREKLKERISLGFKERTDSRRNPRGLWKGSNTRMALIIVALLFFSYWVLHQFSPVFIRFVFG